MLTARQVVDSTVCPNAACSKPAGEECVYAKGRREGLRRQEGPHKVRILAAQDVQPPPPKPIDPPEPPVTPPATRMLTGGCPRAVRSGTSWRSEGAQAVADRYPGGVVRVFLGQLTDVAPRPESAGVVHASWNLDSNPSAYTPDQLAAAMVNLRDGDSVEWVHEADHKSNNPAKYPGKDVSVARLMAEKAIFHAHVKAVRPDLLVVNTLTAGIFEWQPAKLSTFACPADLVGVDFDGVPFGGRVTDYLDWTAAIAQAQNFVRAYGLRGWCAPEVGSVLKPGDDGTQRGAWLRRLRGLLEAGGCLYAAEYGWNPGTTDAFTDAASAEAWKMTA